MRLAGNPPYASSGDETGRRASLSSVVVAGVAVIAATALWLAGTLTGFENAVRNTLFAVQSHPASGRLHIVEMDAASLATIDRWPWPRSHYAKVVDQLSAAGARSIAFDVDFSTPSDPAEDRALAAALARSRAAIALPTFSQRAGQRDGRILDALPIPALRNSATMASVAVAPDADGLVRRMPLGTVTAGMPRPSLSATVTERAGSANQTFPIDFATDPTSIPRHSFAAVEAGRFPPGAFAGKDVLIGATAIEMGDRYATPRFGVIPGVVVQALAAETLYRGVPLSGGPILPLILVVTPLIFIAGAGSQRSALGRGGLSAIGICGGLWAAWAGAATLLEIVPALCAIAVASALTLVRLFRAQQRERQRHDALTGLPNRLAMIADRDAGDDFTVAGVIGGFDKLATVLGDAHAAELIRRVAERLRLGNGGRRVYRLDDSHFGWSAGGHGTALEETLAGLHAVMRHPIEVGGRQVDVQMAFGIAEPGALAEASLSAGDALRAGDRWRYHVAAERNELERQVSLMGELDRALARDELDVLYQPKLHLKSDRVTSVEALVRWNHPERGHLRPDLFIPLAEESDRITELTLYVLQRTIDDLRNWCEAGLVVNAAVNISAKLIVAESFVGAAEALLTRAGVPRHRLIFEVTESATITDPTIAAAALGRFRDLGVAISMDDYGTGQSSLSYLKCLPLSELKIDRSFVQNAHRDRSDALLVRSTVELAHELGLTVVAEGVEDEECLAFLRDAGCDYAQGYLIGKPTSAESIMPRFAPDALAA